MGYIKQLPEDLIKKIAAGEVIERPASIVKELVENSIDANAKKIEIEIEQRGKYIKVSDDGNGIDPDDILLLFSRHATSKIRSFEELWEVDTLGFRGEALASISAVCKIKCKSKHINQEVGFEVKTRDGKLIQNISSISIGTIFEVEDLFYNVPAREKFLKSEATELGHAYDIALSLALSHPNISFKLINNNKIVLNSTGSNDLKQVIYELLGNDLQKKLISISAKNHFLELSGYVSMLEVFRNDRKNSFIFVNDRPVKCQIISKAVVSAYEGLLPPNKFPVVVLNLNFKPKFVDVNVHPTKKEVRYTQPNDVYNLVLRTIQDTVSNHYKKVYKEKGAYSLPMKQEEEKSASYFQAAFNSYAPFQGKSNHIEKDTELQKEICSEAQLFSVSNFSCKIISSSKVISNMTKVSNKTIFEVGLVFEDSMQVVFSGEITGSESYQKDFFNYLAGLAEEIFKTYANEEKIIQKKIIENPLEDKETKEPGRKKPSKDLLYQVWERDNWTCVYCGKQLLDPEVVKSALPNSKDGFTTYINEEGKEVTNHKIREHIATYDHYLPVSRLPQFNFELDNLFASCIGCNIKKSNSLELKSWKVERKNNWNKPLITSGICFNTPKSFYPVKNHQTVL